MRKVVDYISRSNVIRKVLFVTDAMEQIIIGLRANGAINVNRVSIGYHCVVVPL
jgi:hypothetical protein